jgi:large subunit ribosomal protein L10
MAINRSKKGKIISTLEDKFNRAEAVVFTGYKGLTVEDLENARALFREAGVEYQVAKKNSYKNCSKKN